MEDALDAFWWFCEPGSSGKLLFYSVSLKSGRGLRDLLTLAGGWKENFVKLSKGSFEVGASDPAKWWTNPIEALPDSTVSSQTLSSAGTIYVYDSNRAVRGYEIAASSIAIVGLSGAVLEYDRTYATSNCNTTNGTSTTPSAICVVHSGATSGKRSFLWIEAHLGKTVSGATNPAYGLLMANTTFSQVASSSIRGTGTHGLYLFNAQFNQISNVYLHSNSGRGLSLYGGSSRNDLTGLDVISTTSVGITLNNSSLNRIKQARVIYSGSHGVELNSSTANVLGGVFSVNNTSAGIIVGTSSHDNILTELILAANGLLNLDVSSSNGNTISHVTSANAGNGTGLRVSSSTNTTVVQAVLTNNFDHGLIVSGGAGNHQFSQLYVTENNQGGIFLSSSGVNGFFDAILVGGNSGANQCNNASVANQGLTSSCGIDGNSLGTTIISSGLSLTSAFVGPISSEDSVNSSDSSGTASFSSTLDWNHFENFYRHWGKQGAIGSAAARGQCSTGTCQIWDWRILASTTAPVAHKSGNGSSANEAFTSGSACPSAVHGNRAITNFNGITFLLNAVEADWGGAGNGNGLCESWETCVYSPHFGAYQGDPWPGVDSCSFSNGTVIGVHMLAYPVFGI